MTTKVWDLRAKDKRMDCRVNPVKYWLLLWSKQFISSLYAAIYQRNSSHRTFVVMRIAGETVGILSESMPKMTQQISATIHRTTVPKISQNATCCSFDIRLPEQQFQEAAKRCGCNIKRILNSHPIYNWQQPSATFRWQPKTTPFMF